MDHLLSLVLFTPLVGMLVLFALPGRSRLLSAWCYGVLALDLLFSLLVIARLDRSVGLQMVERAHWAPSLGAQYYVGVDGYSALLVVLTALLGLLAALFQEQSRETRQREFYAYLLLLQFAAIGAFLALDFLLFFCFFELVLVPMYLLIAIWGGERRTYAATKFLVYTLAGSVLMLLGGLYLHSEHQRQFGVTSFALQDLLRVQLPLNEQWWVFAAFFAGFAVKASMWPFHTWLPDAHVEAPTAGSVLLAGVLLKLGTYGFLRYALPLAPDVLRQPAWQQALGGLSLVAIVYAALVCLAQEDWKKLVAYSSVSHMGFCTLGMFAGTLQGIQGSMLQQINHGLSTSMLFLLVGMAYERRHTRLIAAFQGLLRTMPIFSVLFFIAVLSSMGFPPLNGFIGEVAILQGVYPVSRVWALGMALGILLSAAYLLWLFQRVSFGEPQEDMATVPDITWRERLLLLPLVAGMFWIGVYAQPWFDLLAVPAANVQQRVQPLVPAPLAVSPLPAK